MRNVGGQGSRKEKKERDLRHILELQPVRHSRVVPPDTTFVDKETDSQESF